MQFQNPLSLGLMTSLLQKSFSATATPFIALRAVNELRVGEFWGEIQNALGPRPYQVGLLPLVALAQTCF